MEVPTTHQTWKALYDFVSKNDWNLIPMTMHLKKKKEVRGIGQM